MGLISILAELLCQTVKLSAIAVWAELWFDPGGSRNQQLCCYQSFEKPWDWSMKLFLITYISNVIYNIGDSSFSLSSLVILGYRISAEGLATSFISSATVTFYTCCSFMMCHCLHSSPLSVVHWRSWNAFHVCANSALAGCPGETAAVWESLRQESRKTQFSGNLYAMCASRTTLPPSTVPAPRSAPPSDQTNQETLKGQTRAISPTHAAVLFPVCSTLLVLLRS